MMSLFHWEKLSPAEFQQLQEYALCEYFKGVYSDRTDLNWTELNVSLQFSSFRSRCTRFKVALF